MKEATLQGHMQTVTFPNIRDALLPILLPGEICVAEAERLLEDAG